jgi:hypothetical protein
MLAAKQRCDRQIRKIYFARCFAEKEKQHEFDGKTKNGVVYLHRQVDTQDFVFAEKPAVSPWAVAPRVGERIAAHADQNPSQSRIRGPSRQACDSIEVHYGRVFADEAGRDDHRSTPRNVPLGPTLSQARECGRAFSANTRANNRIERGIVDEHPSREKNQKSQEERMCPACMESAAVIVAGAASTGGVLAVCIGKLRTFFRVSSHGLFQRKDK